MQAFAQARQWALQAVELDVWLTKDNELAVIHGGEQGEMPLLVGEAPDAERVNIFDLTLAEAREHFSQTQHYLDTLTADKVPFSRDNRLY